MFFSTNVFGIDLGTSSIKIYSKNDDNIVVEKNVIAVENRNTIYAYGDDAFDMYEKAPANIKVSFPLSFGTISDINNMQQLMKYLLTDIQRGRLSNADFLLAVPTEITEVEKRAFFDLIRSSSVKAKKIMAIDKAVADSFGLELEEKTPAALFIVNIGYDTTEISIVSKGGIVLSRLLKIGGSKFDDSIKAIVKKEYNLLIGGKTAENVKMSISDLEKKNMEAVVFGRDIVSGLPAEKAIPNKLIVKCFEEHFNTIIDAVKGTLERIPPELSSDIYKHGIYLTGGSSGILGLKEKMAEITNLNVNISKNGANSVAFGLAKIIQDNSYKNLAYSIEGMNR